MKYIFPLCAYNKLEPVHGVMIRIIASSMVDAWEEADRVFGVEKGKYSWIQYAEIIPVEEE